MRFHHCKKCGYDCCFTCKRNEQVPIFKHENEYVKEELKEELFHDAHAEGQERINELELFGNQDKLDPNTEKYNNEFMKRNAYENDMHVENDELHEYENS